MTDVETPWGSVDSKRALTALVCAFVVFRVALATQSAFGFHQGWNEGHYALIGAGFLSHPLTQGYGGSFVYSVPPLFGYVVAVFFSVFGESALVARLPSVLAGGATIVATYTLGLETFGDRKTALYGATVLALLPFFQLYSGRAQTDATMLAFFTASLTAIVRGYGDVQYPTGWLITGGVFFAAAFAAKQPAILLPAIVLVYLAGKGRFDRETLRRTRVLIGSTVLALVPLAVWFYLNYRLAPTAFVHDWRHELFSRTVPFANVPLVIAVGFVLGVTPGVLALAVGGIWVDVRESSLVEFFRGRRAVLAIWLVLYGGFVLYRTPRGHQYYVVGLLPPLALFGARGFQHLADTLFEIPRERLVTLALVLLVLNACAGSLVLFELSGEFSIKQGGGERISTDSSDFLLQDMSEATVLVPNEYGPPIEWYMRDNWEDVRIKRYRVSSLTEKRVRSIVRNTSRPVYVVYPRPTWSPLPIPDIAADPIYRTPRYNFTIMSLVGSFVKTDSKFTFYLNDRRLVVYRIESNAIVRRSESSRTSPSNPVASTPSLSPTTETGKPNFVSLSTIPEVAHYPFRSDPEGAAKSD